MTTSATTNYYAAAGQCVLACGPDAAQVRLSGERAYEARRAYLVEVVQRKLSKPGVYVSDLLRTLADHLDARIEICESSAPALAVPQEGRHHGLQYLRADL